MSNKLAYKGYHATIEYDADDGLLIGTVFGIRDTLAFHGSSIPEITETFHDCIDTYLEVCKEQGISPDKEFKGSLNVRITPDLHRKAAFVANQEGITLNQLIQQAIEARVQPAPYKNTIIQLPVIQENAIMKSISMNDYGYNSRYRSHPSCQFH
mgnify:CR=1 FL=1